MTDIDSQSTDSPKMQRTVSSDQEYQKPTSNSHTLRHSGPIQNEQPLHSAATEPIMDQNRRREDPIRRRTTYQRAQTLPTGRKSESNQYLVPDRVLTRKPTVKQEASFFYSIIQWFAALKDEIFDKSMERSDQFYSWFWNIGLIKNFLEKWKSWERIFILGECLQIVRLFLNTRAVIFFPFFPVGIACYVKGWDIEAVAFLFLALMYFAKVLSNCTEIAEEHFGPVIGALLNATFGNLVELIISGTTVSKDDATLTITNLIGSIISNNLVVTGTCCFFGGLEGKPIYQKKPLISHLVFFLCITLLIALMSVMADIDEVSTKFKMDTSQIGASLIFLNYLLYLAMQTNEEFKALKIRKQKANEDQEEEDVGFVDSESEYDLETGEKIADSNEDELPSKVVCFGALILSVAGLGPTANFFVDALKNLTDGKNISSVFIGLIILPLAGSLPEHVSSIIAARKGNLDLSVNLAIGSSNQVIGFVLPVIQFISSMYPSTGFSLYIVDEIACYLYVTAFITTICLANGMLYGLNVFHGLISVTTFAFIVYLTFAND